MTTEQYHEIVDNPNRVLTKKELIGILWELKCDVMAELYKEEKIETMRWYAGEVNAFDIAIDLIDHLKE